MSYDIVHVWSIRDLYLLCTIFTKNFFLILDLLTYLPLCSDWYSLVGSDFVGLISEPWPYLVYMFYLVVRCALVAAFCLRWDLCPVAVPMNLRR